MADPATLVTGDPVADRLSALTVFERLSRAFAIGLDTSEPQAYSGLLRDLMDNSALLVSGGLMSAKELLDKIEDLQSHIKKGGTSGRSMMDVFHDFMNSAPPEEAA